MLRDAKASTFTSYLMASAIAPGSCLARGWQHLHTPITRGTVAVIARAFQAFILPRVGCCRRMPALVSRAGDACSCPFATGSRSSKRTFGTGHYRPVADSAAPQKETPAQGRGSIVPAVRALSFPLTPSDAGAGVAKLAAWRIETGEHVADLPAQVASIESSRLFGSEC